MRHLLLSRLIEHTSYNIATRNAHLSQSFLINISIVAKNAKLKNFSVISLILLLLTNVGKILLRRPIYIQAFLRI